MISYRPLRVTMANLNINKMQLRELAKLSPATAAKIGKNEPLFLDTIERICNALHCRIEDVVEFVPNEG